MSVSKKPLKKPLKKVVKKTLKKKVLPKKTLKKSAIKKTIKKSVEKVVKKAVKKSTIKAERGNSQAKERRLFTSELMLKRCYTDKEVEEIVRGKFPDYYMKPSYASEIRWDLNRGNLGLTAPKEQLERIVECDGKKMTSSEKKALLDEKKKK